MKLIKQRIAVRSYADKPVEDNVRGELNSYISKKQICSALDKQLYLQSRHLGPFSVSSSTTPTLCRQLRI